MHLAIPTSPRWNTDWCDGGAVLFACANAHDTRNRKNEVLAVADITGARAFEDRLDCRIDEVIRNGDFDPYLVGELHLHSRAAIRLDTLHFAAMALHAADRQPLH